MEKLTPLIGIVACGGKSERMGKDKSRLIYHLKEQRYHVYDLLKLFCEDVYISCNIDQIDSIEGTYKIILDDSKYFNMGPMTAILSAHKNQPDASLMLIGCDYPLVNSNHLSLLKKSRSAEVEAICFMNAASGFTEPLIAIYENQFLKNILQNYQLHNASLRQMLSKAKIKTIEADSLQLKSVDSEKDFFEIKKRLENN